MPGPSAPPRRTRSTSTSTSRATRTPRCRPSTTCGPGYDADGYYYQWAHDADGERAAFTWFLGELRRREALGGDWHVYHYNSYEVTALERIAENWPDPVESARLVLEVQRLVGERFDDLYRRVEAGVRTRDGSTSLKVVEQLAGYDRGADAAAVARADDSIKAYEAYWHGRSDEREQLLEGIRAYNEHDVRATHAVHLWLRGLAAELSDDDLEDDPVDDYEPSPDVRDRIERTAKRRRELQDAIEAGALPSGLSVESARMLAEMLEWHRREFVVAYQDFLRLKDWAAEREIAPDDAQPDLGPDWLEVNAEAAPTRSGAAPSTSRACSTSSSCGCTRRSRQEDRRGCASTGPARAPGRSRRGPGSRRSCPAARTARR